EITPGQQASAWVYSPGFARDRPDVARRTMVALLRGIRDLYDGINKDINRDQVVEIVTRYLAVREPGPYAALRAQVEPNGQFNADMLQADVDWYVANGFSPQ